MTINKTNRERGITITKLTSFATQNDIAIATYEDLWNLQIHLQATNMLYWVEYYSYTNRKKWNCFFHCILDYVEEVKVRNTLDNPLFSMMLDESINHGLEQHIVVYSTYLDCKGFGTPISQFVKFISVPYGKVKTIYDIITSLKETR